MSFGAAAPEIPCLGETWYSTVTDRWYLYDGNKWVSMGEPLSMGLGTLDNSDLSNEGAFEFEHSARADSGTTAQELHEAVQRSWGIITPNEAATVAERYIAKYGDPLGLWAPVKPITWGSGRTQPSPTTTASKEDQSAR